MNGGIMEEKELKNPEEKSEGPDTRKKPVRVFVYDDHRFPDPGPEFSVEDVRKSLEAFYPELANAKTREKTLKDGTLEITFIKTAGTKGSGQAVMTARSLAATLAGTPPAKRSADVIAVLQQIATNDKLFRRLKCINPVSSSRRVPHGF
jgi:PRTRC genetic system protein C